MNADNLAKLGYTPLQIRNGLKVAAIIRKQGGDVAAFWRGFLGGKAQG